jgi:hypothetical protein
MDDLSRTMLHVGDAVIVQHDDGAERKHFVKYAPWQLGHGGWVVGLSGISGGYDLNRVVRRATNDDR